MRSVPRLANGQAEGFSLVEVLVAAAILASALAALGQVFTIAIRASIEARDVTSETIFAAQKIEELRATAFPDVPLGDFVEYLDAGGRIVDGVAINGAPAFTRTWAVTSFPADPEDTAVMSVRVARSLADASTGRSGVHLISLKTRKGR